MAKVTMPQLGESVAEGTIGKWLKQPGDHVAKYEPLLEVITDKVNAEVPSPFEGILREILAEEGATVPNNAEIAVIETADDGARRGRAPARRDARPAPAAAAAAPSHGGRRRDREPASAAAGPAGSDERRPPCPGRRRPAGTGGPAARLRRSRPPRVAAARATRDGRPRRPDDPGRPSAAARARPHAGADHGHRRRRPDHPRRRPRGRRGDPDRGAGPGRADGRPPRRRDRPQPAAPAAGPPHARRPARRGPGTGGAHRVPRGADEVLLPMTQMRKGIAAQMTRALAVPHAYVHMEVDATGLVNARERAKREYQAREGISLSYVPFVIKAAVEALEQYPTFNAHWTEQGSWPSAGSTWASPSPSTTACSCRSSATWTSSRSTASTSPSPTSPARARAGKLKLDDYGGSTFTIDNTGWFGSNLTMPIINVPEVAILTMEAITKRAGRPGDARRRRHRHPPDHEHGPRPSTIAPTTAPRRPRSCGRSRPGSKPSARRPRSTDRPSPGRARRRRHRRGRLHRPRGRPSPRRPWRPGRRDRPRSRRRRRDLAATGVQLVAGDLTGRAIRPAMPAPSGHPCRR